MSQGRLFDLKDVRKQILNISRAALSQNVPRTDQFKHDLPGVYYRLYLGQHERKTEGRIQIQGILRTTPSISFHQIGFHSYVPTSNKNKLVL